MLQTTAEFARGLDDVFAERHSFGFERIEPVGIFRSCADVPVAGGEEHFAGATPTAAL